MDLTCANCGAPVRAGKSRCGRCGSLETNVVPATPDRRPTLVSRFAILGGIGLVAVIAVTMLSAAPDSQPNAGAFAPTAAADSSVPQASNDGPRVGGTYSPSAFTADDSARLGAAAYNEGDLESAETNYAAAVEADPNDAAAQNNLGQVLVRTGRSQEAIPHFDKAIEIAGDVWSYHFNRARAYSQLKDWKQAIAGYTEAVRLFPHDYATHFNLAKARQADGDLAGAIEGYAKAVELAPGQADFHITLGQALELAGRPAEAAAAYQRFLEMEPDAPQADKIKARLSQLGGSAQPATPTVP